MKGEHPARWVVEQLAPELAEPLHVWYNEIAGNVAPEPRSCRMPASRENVWLR